MTLQWTPMPTEEVRLYCISGAGEAREDLGELVQRGENHL